MLSSTIFYYYFYGRIFLYRRDRTLMDYLGNDADKLDAIFGAYHAICVPPTVELQQCPPNPFNTQEGDTALRLIYPVPGQWWPHVINVDVFTLEAQGWRQQEKTFNLLNGFLGLTEEKAKRVPDKVRAFAEHWGPLWRCRNHYDCFWSHSRGIDQPDQPCRWVPTEDVQEFVREAWRVKAVLESAKLLQGNKLVPKSLWEHLGYGFDKEALPAQRVLLSFVVNVRLGGLGGSTLRMTWHRSDRPKLDIVSGFGFLRAVWQEVAQILCDVSGIPLCDRCGRRYIREGRKPKANQGGYCSACRVNDRGSKARSAAHRRALERQARQLHVEGVTSEDISQQLKPSAGRIKVDAETVQKWVFREGSEAHH
jgi:hypothetical protein